MQAIIPLSLYIHLPWCVSKCPYCDFNSHGLKQALPEADYVAALIQDLEQDLPKIWGRRIDSIFFGGGTPSLFSAEGIDAILCAVRARLNVAPSIEITLEANPGTIEQQRFAGYRQAGVNRISLGIQSFNDAHLKTLGRIHGSKEALLAIETVRQAGFDNFNCDLMHALPQQSLAQALADLQQAIANKPPHISWYQLTLEPNTRFYQTPPTLPNEDLVADMQLQGRELLANHGYQQYEVSAYSQPNKYCRHNLNYWKFGDYLGIGAGAHSKLTCPNTGDIRRIAKVRHPKEYLNPEKNVIQKQDIIDKAQLPFEFMLNALRLKQSLTWQLLKERTGLVKQDLAPSLNKLKQLSLIEANDVTMTLTPRGHLFLDDVVAEFIST